ncbi:DNA-3-methyladenine glycosylase family protein [Candidatus Nitrosotenuis cloacae]|uniref:DNA-3-methyladenine glycosylase n=1 Tax=Candidatus Nitrosotenuis cloacae TaxID=1603555 RepID=A0A3G1B1L5_9ARCH|nr:DNA-3-methyladenine glycosylase [Candidatus Nitrosotenuis cloacae]AJZ76018.1 DNA-3-methyladenine glycosylase [Candidatus Nitrosotenuis cloacae]
MIALNHLRKDRKLAKIIDRVGEFNLSLTKNPYQSLVEAIITQQLSGKAADSISTRFRAIYGRFPKPADVMETSDAKLRKAGLSYMKVSYIKDLSKKVESKEIRLAYMKNLTDEEIIVQLTQVKGIGRWTAEMFLIFSLGRLDVLPVGDLGLKKGIQKLYSLEELPEKEQMERIAEKWKPYRSVATWYLWRSLDESIE